MGDLEKPLILAALGRGPLCWGPSLPSGITGDVEWSAGLCLGSLAARWIEKTCSLCEEGVELEVEVCWTSFKVQLRRYSGARVQSAGWILSTFQTY